MKTVKKFLILVLVLAIFISVLDTTKTYAQEQIEGIGEETISEETKEQVSLPQNSQNEEVTEETSEEVEETLVPSTETEETSVAIEETTSEKTETTIETTTESTKSTPRRVRRAATASTIYLDAQNGADSNAGTSEAEAVKTFAQAMTLVADGGNLVVKSFDVQSGIVVNKKITVLVDGNISLQAANAETGITLKAGSSLKISAGKTLTMTGYKHAIVIEKDAVLGDGNYVISNTTFGFRNYGRIEGSSKSALNLAVNCVGRGMEYNSTAVFRNATITLNAKSDSNDTGAWGGHGANLHLENVDLITTDYRFNLQSKPQNLYMKDSTLKIKGKWKTGGFFSTPQAMGLVGVSGTPSELINSHLIIDGGRITISDKVNLTNSTLEILNSSSGGLNINYGGVVVFNDSTLTTKELTSTPSYGVQEGNLTFNGNSVVKVFKGWYYTAADGTQQKFDYATTPITSDMTVTAKWEEETRHTVSFDTNGGEAIEDKVVIDGQSLDVSQITPKKTNAEGKANIFLGWYTDKAFAASSKVTGNYAPTGDVILYAKWDIHPDPVEKAIPVHGDILVQKEGDADFNTQDKEVFKVHQGDTLNYRATIEAKETQTYLNGLKAQLITSERTWLTDKRPGDKITLEDVLINF